MTLEDLGYEDVVVFSDYESALIGVTIDNRAVYDYDKMIEYLIREDGMSGDEAIEWIEYNTIRSLPYAGDAAPIIVNLI